MYQRRTRIIVDGNLQWRLTRRAISTWLTGLVAIFAVPISITFMAGVFVFGHPASSVVRSIFEAASFPLILALLVIPLGIRDSFQFSNRIAGPMMRMKRNMADLAAGQPIHSIRLRPGDFFVDVVDQFNELTESYQKLQRENAELRGESASPSASPSSQPEATTASGAPLFPTVGGWQVDSQLQPDA